MADTILGLGLVDPATGIVYKEKLHDNTDSFARQVYAQVVTVKGSKTLAQTSVTTAATLLLAANTSRKTATLRNTSTTITVYLGKDNTVTSSTGYPLLPNEALADDDTSDAWYAIAASGTVTVATIEVA